MTEPGYQPREPRRPGGPGRGRPGPSARNSGWQTLDAFDGPAEPESETPPWAIPGGVQPVRPARRPSRAGAPAPPEPDDEDVLPELPARTGRRPGRSRAAAGRRRRGRRRLLVWGCVAIVVVIAVGVGYYVSRPSPKRLPYVTSLQKGEYARVPDPCQVLPATALSSYLGGNPSKGVQSSGGGKSECTYQYDAKPVFRVLELTIAAYPPSLIPPGNGSATSYAVYTFGQARQQLVQPPEHAPEPRAKIIPVGRIGAESFGALQVYRIGSVQDRVTVLTRWHNVLITASLWATVSGGFGPVSVSQLSADVQQATRQALTALQHEPAVG